MQEAKIKITAESKDADSQIKKFSASFKSSIKEVEDVAKKAAVGIAAISGAVLGVSYAYGQQEKAEFKLQAALIANGRQVDKTMKSYINFASEIQALTIVGDETTLKLLQTAESMGLTGDTALRAAKNAIAMQGAFDIGAEGAIRMTVALEQGESEMLRRYIPALKSIDNDTQRAAAAQDILAKAFDVAKAEANTFGGAVIQLKNAFGDALQVIGEPFAKDLKIAAGSLKEFFTVLQTNPVFIENIKNAKNVLKEFFLFIYDNQKILGSLAGAYLILGTSVAKYTAGISLAIIAVEKLTRAEANLKLLAKMPEFLTVKTEYQKYGVLVEQVSGNLKNLENRYRELRALPELSLSEKLEINILQERLSSTRKTLQSYTEEYQKFGDKLREINQLEIYKLAGEAQGPFEKAVIDLIGSINKIGNIEIPKIKDEKMLEEIKATGTAAAKKFQEGFVFYEDFESIDNFIFAVVNKFDELNKISAIGIDSESIISDTTKSEALAAIEILQLYKEKGIEVNQALVDSIVESVRKGREEISQLTLDTLEDDFFRMEEYLMRYSDLSEQQSEIDKRNYDLRISAASSFFGNLSKLQNTKSKELFEIGKAAAIGNAIVDTYAGAQKAIAQLGVFGIPVAAAIVAGGLANIATIASTSFGGGGSGVGMSSTTPVTSTQTGLTELETGNNQRQSNVTIEFNVAGSIVSGEKENFQQLVRETIIPLLQDEANIRVGGLGIA